MYWVIKQNVIIFLEYTLTNKWSVQQQWNVKCEYKADYYSTFVKLASVNAAQLKTPHFMLAALFPPTLNRQSLNVGN